MSFRERVSLETRLEESNRVLSKYPDRLPIIVEIAENSSLPPLDKNKYLVPTDLTMGQFMFVVRKRITLNSDQALFLFLDNDVIPAQTDTIMQVYSKHKSPCGFLFITVSTESVFGASI